MGGEARMGAADGLSRKASEFEWEAKNSISSAGPYRQNVIKIGPEFDLKKQPSKMKDEPVMLLKKNNLINDKMSNATILLNRKDLDIILGNLIKMC
jgi:hypothetical protein